MMQTQSFTPWTSFKPEDVGFTLGQDRAGKPTVNAIAPVAIVTPAASTNWPRVNGQGNYGTMFGPSDPTRAKFTLDLTDSPINHNANDGFDAFMQKLNILDDKLLNFVHSNQLRILSRKNLTLEEVKMLQIRSTRPKYDKATGNLQGYSLSLSAPTYQWNGMGSKVAATMPVVDYEGKVIVNGTVNPGDIVAATAFINQIYTNVGGDKFGIHWSFTSVQILMQRASAPPPTCVPDFGGITYDWAVAYTEPEVVAPELDKTNLLAQFPDAGTV
jgi:hypothetical protein